MRLTALVESVDHVCCRYRLAAFRPFLEAAGHSLELRPLPRNWLARLTVFRSLRGADVVLQRRLLPVWQLGYLRRCVRRLLYDFDDAVFLRDSYASRGLHDRARMRRFAATVRASDAVLAGNSCLQTSAQALGGRASVHLVPTCVDPARYRLAEPGQGRGGLELAWIGSSSTLQGLERSAALLEQIGAAVPGLRLKLICDRALTLRNLEVVACPWSEASEADSLASANVGISWIPEDDWSRGKCGLKVLQYMAAGLPVVANPVGVQAEMVRHGETGFLAGTTGEWVTSLRSLAGDADLRTRMGRAGRQRVEERYAVATGARRWLEVLESLGAERRRTA